MPRPPEVLCFTWRDVACRVHHIRDWKLDGWSRLIVRAVSSPGAPLPFAEGGGYHVTELDEDELKAAGGPVAFLLSRMEQEACSIRYAQALYRWKQGDLFRWKSLSLIFLPNIFEDDLHVVPVCAPHAAFGSPLRVPRCGFQHFPISTFPHPCNSTFPYFHILRPPAFPRFVDFNISIFPPLHISSSPHFHLCGFPHLLKCVFPYLHLSTFPHSVAVAPIRHFAPCGIPHLWKGGFPPFNLCGNVEPAVLQHPFTVTAHRIAVRR